jgi:hypothetical protein
MVERKNKNDIFRMSFLILYSLIIIVSTPTQKSVQAQRNHQESLSSQALELKITMPANRACHGSCLNIEAEITNVSEENVVIDAKGLRYRISVEKFRPSLKGASVHSLSIQGDYGPEQYNETGYYVLKPKESHKTSFAISLRGDFFSDYGSYTITTTYGQFRKYTFNGTEMFQGTVKSNGVEFNIARCNPDEIKKSPRDCE